MMLALPFRRFVASTTGVVSPNTTYTLGQIVTDNGAGSPNMHLLGWMVSCIRSANGQDDAPMRLTLERGVYASGTSSVNEFRLDNYVLGVTCSGIAGGGSITSSEILEEHYWHSTYMFHRRYPVGRRPVLNNDVSNASMAVKINTTGQTQPSEPYYVTFWWMEVP